MTKLCWFSNLLALDLNGGYSVAFGFHFAQKYTTVSKSLNNVDCDVLSSSDGQKLLTRNFLSHLFTKYFARTNKMYDIIVSCSSCVDNKYEELNIQ